MAGGPHNAVFVVWESMLPMRLVLAFRCPSGTPLFLLSSVPASELAGYFRWSLRDRRCGPLLSTIRVSSRIWQLFAVVIDGANVCSTRYRSRRDH
jgi:hypothetical protein